jgi:1-acyl-sn-glycerol-3-phosphate acyltransferase
MAGEARTQSIGTSQRMLYMLGRSFVRLYARLMLQVDVLWQATPPAGPKLIVANHPSCSDPIYLSLLFPQPITLLLTQKAFAVPLLGTYLRRSGHISVTIGDGRAAFEAARRSLERGRSVALFPEGFVSPQKGGFHPPYTGAARLALLAGVPIVPVGIYLPRERNLAITSRATGERSVGYWYLRGPYGMTVGPAMHFETIADGIDDGNGTHAVAVTERVMQRIISLAAESEQRVRAATLNQTPCEIGGG